MTVSAALASLKIHSFIVETSRGPLVISLSKEYSVAIEDSAIDISEIKIPELPKDLQSKVGSFHAVFGINGSGKTEVLLQLAKGLGTDPQMGDVSVLYEYQSHLQLYLSPELRRHKIRSLKHVLKTETCPALPAIFYTSSPYENQRRRQHKKDESRENWIDVSPSYGKSNRLDGLSLFEKLNELPGGFIKNAKMEVREHLLDLPDIFSKLEGWFSDLDNEEGIEQLGYFLKHKIVSRQDQELFRLYCTVLDESSTNFERLALLGYAVDKIFSIRLTRFDKDGEPIDADDLSTADARQVLRDLFVFLEKQTKVKRSEAKALLIAINSFRGWRQKAKKRISQTLPSIQKNLRTVIPNKKTQSRCSQLGLIEFALDGLSSGQTAISMFYAAIHGALKELNGYLKKPMPFLILIDEGEMFLHPKWQQEYIAGIHRLVGAFPRLAPYANIVISTHSIVVAADAPPNSLLSLDDTATVNGFGLGPQTLLRRVYDVNDLAGGYTHKALERLAAFVTSPSARNKEDALRTALLLADNNIKNHLVGKINLRKSTRSRGKR